MEVCVCMCECETLSDHFASTTIDLATQKILLSSLAHREYSHSAMSFIGKEVQGNLEYAQLQV